MHCTQARRSIVSFVPRRLPCRLPPATPPPFSPSAAHAVCVCRAAAGEAELSPTTDARLSVNFHRDPAAGRPVSANRYQEIGSW